MNKIAKFLYLLWLGIYGIVTICVILILGKKIIEFLNKDFDIVKSSVEFGAGSMLIGMIFLLGYLVLILLIKIIPDLFDDI